MPSRAVHPRCQKRKRRYKPVGSKARNITILQSAGGAAGGLAVVWRLRESADTEQSPKHSPPESPLDMDSLARAGASMPVRRDTPCRRQPQGAAFDAATSCLNPVQGSVESKSASPPFTAASS